MRSSSESEKMEFKESPEPSQTEKGTEVGGGDDYMGEITLDYYSDEGMPSCQGSPDYPVLHLYELPQQGTEVTVDYGEPGDLEKTFTVKGKF